MRKGYVGLIVAVVLASALAPAIADVPQVYPSSKWHVIVWPDEGGEWIIDVHIVSPMPWQTGKVETINLSITVRSAPEGKTLQLVATVLKNGSELTSAYIGELKEGEVINTAINLYFPQYFYGTFTAGQLISDSVTLVFNGYTGSATFESSTDFPVIVYVQPSILKTTVLISGSPYRAYPESLRTLNISVIIDNISNETALGIQIDVYLDNELIDRYYLAELKPTEQYVHTLTKFTYIYEGVHHVTAIVTYSLPDGTSMSTAQSAIIEGYRPVTVSLVNEQEAVIEGGMVLFRGEVHPLLPSISRVYIEMERGGTWAIIGTASIDTSGNFTFTWKAPDLPTGVGYEIYRFRARVPVAKLNSSVSAYSNVVDVVVYSKTTVVDTITDIRLRIEPPQVVSGSNVSITVVLVPQLPIGIPVKVLYYDSLLDSWISLADIDTYNGTGATTVTVMLPPGKYMMKAIVVTPTKRIESAPYSLTVYEPPALVLSAPNTALVNTDIALNIAIQPRISNPVVVSLELLRDGALVSAWNITVPMEGSVSTTIKAPSVPGTYTITAEAEVMGVRVTDEVSLNVIRPNLTLTLGKDRVEGGDSVVATITLTPPMNLSGVLQVLKGSEVIVSERFNLSQSGVALITFTAPEAPDTYEVVAEIPDLGLTANASLSVYEVIRSLTLTALNTTVTQGQAVTLRLELNPPPSGMIPADILINTTQGWEPLTTAFIDSTGTAVVSAQLPEEPGTYYLKAEIPSYGIESDVVTVEVVSAGGIIPTEYLIGAIAAAAAVSVLLFIKGRRR